MSEQLLKRTPRVSVIMPSYNTAPLIGRCLDSVFEQTFQDFEVVLVNDGSPDTPQLERVLSPHLEKHGDKIVYIKQENKRCAGARNTAIRNARGEFVAFLDSDDVWLPDHLAEQMKLLEQEPTLDLVYCNALAVGDPSHPHEFMKRCPSSGQADFQALLLDRCQIPVSTVVCRRTALERAGLFDETLLRCDDYDMWLRAAFYGARIGYTRKLQVHVNGGRPGSLGASQSGMVEAAWIIFEKALKNLPLAAPDRNLVQSRATETKALYLLEEGRYRLHLEEFDKAKNLFREANRYFRRSKLKLVLAGLAVAPKTTRMLAELLAKVQMWSLRYPPSRRY
jgi:glycosyltransferase involved in cell wall biosynthesis